jgi:probable rRNA maturation factor
MADRLAEVNVLVRPLARKVLSRTHLATLTKRAKRMATAAGLGAKRLAVGLILTGDEEIHELNRAYRGKDKPTDVLAFSMQEGEAPSPGMLGDVIISVETARRQRGKRTLLEEIAFLWAHGLCHLLGYDHATDEEEAEMNARAQALDAEGRRRGPVRAA